MLSKISSKLAHTFYCEHCDYSCSKSNDYKKHCLTNKHNAIINGENATLRVHECKCGKVYKHSSSYYRHIKACTDENIQYNNPPGNKHNPHMDTTIVIELLKQNQDFKDLMVEQAKQLAEQSKQLAEQQQEQNNKLIEQNKHILDQNEKITELAKNAGSVTNHNTTNNTTNKFNLNVFLNETCKDAITMNEFINSVEVTMEDFIRTGEIGFVDGISTVMVERIKGMEMHTRPMHCTDLKRETMYIKNDNAWEKGDTDKTLLRRAVKNIANKNYRQLKPWFDSSQPEVDQIGTDEYENYFQYYKSALGGCGKEEDRKFEDKIIKNVLKEIVVDK